MLFFGELHSECEKFGPVDIAWDFVTLA